MADDMVDDQAGKEFYDPKTYDRVTVTEKFMKKIDELGCEREGLVNEIVGRKTEIEKLTEEIDNLREDKLKMQEKIEGLERVRIVLGGQERGGSCAPRKAD
ncbi:hypothetical protein K1719_027525 [Acacia pycnantha]|nr:hypothetical protein K1719_027525 [Acacia pycnantha]